MSHECITKVYRSNRPKGRGLRHTIRQSLALRDRKGKNWRFGTDKPEELLASYGWNTSVIQLGEIRANYGRDSVQITPRSLPGRRRSLMAIAKKE